MTRSIRRAAPWVGLLAVLAACSATASSSASVGVSGSSSASAPSGVTGSPGPSRSAGVVALSSPSALASGLAHFSESEWGVDYPAAWRYYPISGFAFSFGSVEGYLASTPVDTGRICETTPNSKSCDARAYDLPQGNVVIAVGTGGIPMNDPVAFFDHPSEGTPTRVGGMAAVFKETRQSAERTLLTWEVARPIVYGNWVQLDADIRGPGEDILRAQVEALVASLRFTPEPTPISDDPAVARTIARQALAELKSDPAYACFPDAAGVSRRTTITSLPLGPPLDGPVPVTCSATIAPTDVGFWKLDMAIAWDAAEGRTAGASHTVQWLAPDGTLSGSGSSGDVPGG
jgi:hypothetical protein